MATLDDIGFIGFWTCDFRTGDVHASAEVNRLFGVCLSAQMGKLGSEYEGRIHPDDLAWLRRERARSFGPSGIGVVEYRMIDPLGNVRWIMCRARYVSDEAGELVSGRGVLFDVTSFKDDDNRVRSSPAGIRSPLIQVTDLVLEAYMAAEKLGEPSLLTALSQTLMTAGRLLARECPPQSTPPSRDDLASDLQGSAAMPIRFRRPARPLAPMEPDDRR